MDKLSDRQLYLIDSYCSGNLMGEEFKELENQLRDNKGLRQTLVEYRGLEASLRATATASAIQKEYEGFTEPDPKKHALMFPVYSMAAAIVILLSVIGFLLVNKSETPELRVNEKTAIDEGVAVLMKSLDAKWKSVSLALGESVKPGKWELVSGQIELEFYSGAAVVLEGPAVFEVLSENGGVLHSGKLSAEVPDHAHGFTITSADVKLVDLGTSFGMSVNDGKGTEVHVFDGEVELHDLAKNKHFKKLKAGEGQKISSRNQWAEIRVKPEEFVSSQELNKKSLKRQEEGIRKWQESFQESLKDSRLIARYSFDKNTTRTRTLKNASKVQSHGINGAIIGTRWSEGPWPGKDALDFKRPGDRVRINIPGTYESITMTTWIRIDGFDNYFNSLMLSDGWNRMGAVHWQIIKEGKVELAVYNGTGKYHNHRADFEVKPSELGSWIHAAVTYDGKGKVVKHYRNGALIGVVPIEGVVPLEIFKAQIGNWTPKGHNQIRNFNGRFSDFTIYGASLSEGEIQKIYDSSSLN